MRIFLLFLLTLLSSLTLFSSASAQAATGMELALQDEHVFLHQTYYNRDVALTQARQLGVSWIRVNLYWHTAAGSQARLKKVPRKRSYDFRAVDSVVDHAAQYGIRVQVTLGGKAPAYATANRRVGTLKPNPKLFAEFSGAAARHFKGRVSRFSIWNEPNYSGWLQPLRQAPQLYRGLYAASYSSIKRANPRAAVWFGELSPYSNGSKAAAIAPLRFMREATCLDSRYQRRAKCAPLKADGLALHPYDFRHAPNYQYPGKDNVTIGTLARLNRALTLMAKRRALVAPRGGAPDIYLTEYGYFAGGSRRISAAKQAAYMRQSILIAQRTPRVKQLLQYMLIGAGDPVSRRWDTSILRGNGTLSPAFESIFQTSQELAQQGKLSLPQPGPLALPRLP